MNTTFDKRDLVEYIEQFVDLKDCGKYYTARCPFHNDKNPSFVVYPNKNPQEARWVCLACQPKGGDIIDFCMLYHKLSFYEAKAIVCEELTPQEVLSRQIKARYTYRPYDRLLLAKRLYEKFGKEPLSKSIERSRRVDEALAKDAFNEIEAIFEE